MATVEKEEEKQPKQNSEKITIQRDRSGLYGLHVSNISAEINEMDLRSLFDSSGFVKICKIIKTMSNRVAFVKFEDHEEALQALKLHGTKMGDSCITIRPAFESQKLRGNRYHRERTNSSESLSKSRKGHQNLPNPSSGERASSVDEKMVGEQKSHKDENSDVFYASQDVRQANNTSDVNSVPTSSPGKNGAQNLPGLKSNGNTTTQVYPTATSSSGRSYVQFPKGPRNMAQTFAGPQASYIMASSNTSQMLSSGRPSPSRSCDYRNDPRQGAGSINSAQDGFNYSGGVNNMYSHSSNNPQTIKPYMMHNGTANPQVSPPFDISKPMRDLRVSNPGSAYSPSNISKWSVADVIKYYKTQEECSQSMVDFLEEQEIDGNALMLLEQESLLHFMKLGPALKLLNLRDKLKH